MAQPARLATVVLLALTPSACSLLDGLGGLTGGGGDDAGGDVVEPEVPVDALGADTMDTQAPPMESGADAPRDSGRETQPDTSTMDVAQDTTPPQDVQQEPYPFPYFQVVAMDGPQAYWRLDEPAGSTTAKDATGHGHDGTYTGGVTLGSAGAIANDADTAATFDGTSGYVDVKNAFQFAGMTAFTLEAWVKPNLDGQYHAWLACNDGQPPSEGYLAYVEPMGPFYVIERIDSATKVFANGNVAPANATWAHVVVTYEAGTGANVWVNGQIGTGSTNDVSLAGATSDFVIGAENGGATSWWSGEIDEVAVYSYVLPASRILVHYQVGTGQ
ncbi:MAG TPA: LamG domain-containing protein [Polyangiaceae bacterium]